MMDAVQLFLLEHARTHGTTVAPAAGPLWLEDTVVGDVTEDQLRLRPTPGSNSLAWLLWHVARIEDVAVNTVLADRPQVLDQDDWPERLGIARRDVGSGMHDTEVSDMSAQVNIAALRPYRAAVGQRTREVVTTMTADDLQTLVTAADVRRAVRAGAFGAQAGWLESFWEGKSKAWYLSWTAAGHSYLHLGEAMAVRGQAGLAGGR